MKIDNALQWMTALTLVVSAGCSELSQSPHSGQSASYSDSTTTPDIVSPVTPPEAVGGASSTVGAENFASQNPDINRERNLDRNRVWIPQDAQHGFSSDALNRDRLLNQGPYGATAPAPQS